MPSKVSKKPSKKVVKARKNSASVTQGVLLVLTFLVGYVLGNTLDFPQAYRASMYDYHQYMMNYAPAPMPAPAEEFMMPVTEMPAMPSMPMPVTAPEMPAFTEMPAMPVMPVVPPVVPAEVAPVMPEMPPMPEPVDPMAVDSDGDGVSDYDEMMNSMVNNGGTTEPAIVDANGNGIPDSEDMMNQMMCDTDGDGVMASGESCTGSDNCSAESNPLQENADSDSMGDVCDACPNNSDSNCVATCIDPDNDGILDIPSTCILGEAGCVSMPSCMP